MRIAMVSEHASPLAVLGGVDAGGQNVHVAALSDELARRGHAVSVFTRRDDPDFSDRVRLPSGVEVVHVAAGPPEPLPKDDLLPHMFRFARVLRNAWEEEPPDVVHAHFWMSGVASLEAASALSLPVVETFHALGVVKRRHQGADDTSPAERLNATDIQQPAIFTTSVALYHAALEKGVISAGQFGAPSYISTVAPAERGP